MKLYSYNPINGFFAGEMILNESDKSPLEPDVYLIPANCTEIPPLPVLDGNICIWSGEWKEVPNIIPDIPADTELTPREKAKLERDIIVANIRVTVNNKVFDGDEVAQSRMNRAITVLTHKGLPSTLWILANNDSVIITLEELVEALYLAGLAQTEVWVI
jgi:hypothetical protein